jgi:hypothetical protein
MAEMRGHCGDCTWYDLAGSLVSGDKMIRCVAAPPQMVVLPTTQGLQVNVGFPPVRKEQLCCGQFKTRASDFVDDRPPAIPIPGNGEREVPHG